MTQKNQNSICMVIPYFGAWPSWFDFYLQSCAGNNTVDWLFYTDCGEPAAHPANTKFIQATLASFNQLASKKLGMPIAVKKTYKLCDFKPAYGVIFEDYLEGYDFWGFGDIDLIYGNIRKLITDKILLDHDIVTACGKFLSGPFTIFKNDDLKYLYRDNPDYKNVFRDKNYLGFDETGSLTKFEQVFFSNPVPYQGNGIASVSHQIAELINQKKIAVYAKTLGMDFQNQFIGNKFKFDNGSLTDRATGREILYFHFLTIKNYRDFLVPKNTGRNVFFITNHQIYYDSELSFPKRAQRNVARLSKEKPGGIIRGIMTAIDTEAGRFGIWLKKNYPIIYHRLKKKAAAGGI
jgi:hypothetical protein